MTPTPAEPTSPDPTSPESTGPDPTGPEPTGPVRPPTGAGELIAVGPGDSARPVELAAWLRRVAVALARSARDAGVRSVAGGRWLAGVLSDAAPRLPIRTRAALLASYPGRSDDEIADAVILAATRTTGAIGAAAGVLSAAEFAAPPALLASPVQIAAETLAVAATEIKLLAELHELYQVVVPADSTDRGWAYLSAWAQRSVISPGRTHDSHSVRQIALRQVRGRLLRRAGRNMTSMAPLMAGAVVGAEVNRRATRELGRRLVADLRSDAHRQDR